MNWKFIQMASRWPTCARNSTWLFDFFVIRLKRHVCKSVQQKSHKAFPILFGKFFCLFSDLCNLSHIRNYEKMDTYHLELWNQGHLDRLGFMNQQARCLFDGTAETAVFHAISINFDKRRYGMMKLEDRLKETLRFKHYILPRIKFCGVPAGERVMDAPPQVGGDF